jgi:hypothetical protein
MLNIKDDQNKDSLFLNKLFLADDDIINLNDYMKKELFNFNNKNSIYSKIINNLIIVNDEIYILLVLNVISNNLKEMSIIKIYNYIPTILENIINNIILKFKIKGDPDYIISKYKIRCIYYSFIFSNYKNIRIDNKKIFNDKLNSLNIKDIIQRIFTHSIANKETFFRVINKLYNNKYE